MWILISALKDTKELFGSPTTIIPKSFHPEKAIDVWNRLQFGKYFINSFIMVTGAIIAAIFFNGLLAYCFSVLKPNGWKIIYGLVLWSLMIPNIVSLAPLFINISSLNLTDNWIPLWLSFGANAFFVLLYKNFFDNIPKSLGESAMLDGCSNFSIFTKIFFPLSKSINLVIIIFAFNAAWSEFLLSYLVLKDINMHTVMVKLFTMNGTWGMSADKKLIALGFSIIPPVIIFIIFQKYINRGITLSEGIKE